ncbi:hypothetical protein BRADI_4g44085v3 [Brachypodium distachyon]|uniref:Uncharacterized protein n=1 Tax=Brachypodium distachyon TaxID=15368 RepID=A0A2K2CU35_BRADI|nr:hypothetical protein BRADI_4g44085v3 [Brachypodium distachyon]
MMMGPHLLQSIYASLSSFWLSVPKAPVTGPYHTTESQRPLPYPLLLLVLLCVLFLLYRGRRREVSTQQLGKALSHLAIALLLWPLQKRCGANDGGRAWLLDVPDLFPVRRENCMRFGFAFAWST